MQGMSDNPLSSVFSCFVPRLARVAVCFFLSLTSVVTAQEPAAAVATAAVQGALVIRAHKESWVQVRDAGGRVLLQKALAAGESYSAEGSPPWRVVIGRADATEVIVRDQPMDLKAVSRENVARFEVK